MKKLSACLCIVSIHAPVRGATGQIGLLTLTFPVSIHAPVRGATKKPSRHAWRRSGFNPRAREGRDEEMPTFEVPAELFQSTRP